jgi:hypothetical protein
MKVFGGSLTPVRHLGWLSVVGVVVVGKSPGADDEEKKKRWRNLVWYFCVRKKVGSLGPMTAEP